MRNQPRRPVFFWLVLLVCGVYAGFFALTTYAVARHYGVIKAPGWNVRATNTGWFVSDVDQAGPAAGRVERGDRLLAINGDERYATLGIFNWRLVDGGSTYRVDLDRRGERLSLALPMSLVPGKQLHPLLGLIGLVFNVCGAFLGLARPQDAQVRLIGALPGTRPAQVTASVASATRRLDPFSSRAPVLCRRISAPAAPGTSRWCRGFLWNRSQCCGRRRTHPAGALLRRNW